MAKDYAKVSNSRLRAQSRGQLPAARWFWIIVGMLLGAVVTSVLFLEIQRAHTIKSVVVPADKMTVTKSSHVQPAKDEQKPEFDFYTILPQKTITDVTSTKDNITKQPLLSIAKTQEQYVIQVAAFRQPKDAKRVQDNLIGQGFSATLKSLKVKDHGVITRVLIGPFKSRTMANLVRRQLIDKHFEGIILAKAE